MNQRLHDNLTAHTWQLFRDRTKKRFSENRNRFLPTNSMLDSNRFFATVQAVISIKAALLKATPRNFSALTPHSTMSVLMRDAPLQVFDFWYQYLCICRYHKCHVEYIFLVYVQELVYSEWESDFKGFSFTNWNWKIFSPGLFCGNSLGHGTQTGYIHTDNL